MALAEIQALKELAKEMGIEEGPELTAFLRDERAKAREMRQAEQEKADRAREQQQESDNRDREAADRARELQQEAANRARDQEHALRLAEIQRDTARETADRHDATRIREGELADRRAAMRTMPKLQPFDDKNDDMDAFIRRFESYAVSLEWPIDKWALNLSALLHGIALAVYNRQPVNDTSNYDSLKEALLRKFLLTEEGFREKLRTAKPERGESFGQFMTRLEGYFNRWIELGHVDKTYQGLKDALLREQAMSVVTRNLRIFIMERKPKDIGEMSILAEQYLKVHGNTYNFANVDKHKQNVVGQQQSKYTDRSNVGMDRRMGHKEDTPSVVKVDTNSNYHRDTRSCYLCQKVGHIARNCRVVKKPSPASQSSVKAMHAIVKSDECVTLAHERVGDDQRVKIDNGGRGVQTRELSTDTPVANMPVVEGRISGRTENVSVLRNTGCSGGIIRRSMCSEDSFTGETRTCVMINGDTFTAPVVNIMVDTPYFIGWLNALSVEKPVYDIVVGNIPGARDANDPDVNWRPDVDTSDDIHVVRTEEITASTDVSCVVTTRANKVEKRMKPLHVVKSREVEIDSKELQRLQENDPTLSKIRTWIKEGKGQRSRPKWKERFYIDKSIMYREHETSAKKGSVSTTQLVLPKNLREGVMEVAHDSILGGHLGGKKILEGVTSDFHWPEVAGDVQSYVESCGACQQMIPIGRNVKFKKKKRKSKHNEQEGCDHSKPVDISQVKRRNKSETTGPICTNARGESETHDVSKTKVKRKRWKANETEDTGNYEPCDEKTQKKKTKTFHANTVRKYVSREKNEDKRLKDDVVEGLQLVSEYQDSHLGSEDAMFCPLEATESWTDVSIGPQLTDVQHLETRHLLEEYGDVFSDLPGHTDITECTIELVDDTPIRCKNYPVPFAMEQVMKEEVIKMDRMGITEPSTSDYASPSVIVRKQDGSHRYCIDFRRINMVSLTDSEPMPNQEMVIGKLGASGYFTKIDLSKGYWQIPIQKEHRYLTAFQTEMGLRQFRVMPFGLNKFGAVFCRMVRELFQGLPNVESYIDDLTIHTPDWEGHLDAVRRVLERLRQHSLTARPTKCEVGYNEIKLLGQVVGKGVVKIQGEKVRKILEVSKPKTKKDLRSFLGAVGFHKKFIDRFAERAKSLTDMTRKWEPNVLKWSKSAAEAYLLLKSKTSEHPVLRLPQFDKPMILCTDASDVGIGAVLMQEFDGEKLPIVYASRKLNPAETRYSTIERECLAIVWATKRFHPYLYGREFLIEFDHKPLLLLNKSNIDNGRVTRWALAMQKYRYSIRSLKGQLTKWLIS